MLSFLAESHRISCPFEFFGTSLQSGTSLHVLQSGMKKVGHHESCLPGKLEGEETHQQSFDSFLPSRFSAGREGSATEALSRCAEISQPQPDCNILHSAGRATCLGSAQVAANFLYEENLQLPPSNLREPWDCHPANIEPPVIPSNALSSPPLSPWPSIVQASALMRSNLLMSDPAEDISN